MELELPRHALRGVHDVTLLVFSGSQIKSLRPTRRNIFISDKLSA